MLSALVFFLFLPMLKRTSTISLDFDWLYRKGGQLFYKATDKSLNSLNAATRKGVVDGFIPRVSGFFTTAPSRILSWLVTPVWLAQGLDSAEREKRRAQLFERGRRGAFPIGITAILGVVLLGVLYVFSWFTR